MILGRRLPRSEHLVKIAEVVDIDVRKLLISAKRKDLSEPAEEIKEISRIVGEVRRD